MSPRPQIDHIRKPQLLTAAAEVIAERGFAATRIADVAERAGTSGPAVLYWFESREQLLVEALTFAEQSFYDELEARLASIRSPGARLVALIDASIGDDEDWVLWMELWGRALRDADLRAARQGLDDRWREQIAGIVSEGIEAGEFSDCDPRRAALELAALMDGLAVQVALGDAVVTPAVMRAVCIEVAQRLVGVGELVA